MSLQKPILETFGAPTGETAIGYHRTDGVPIVHVIMQAKPGTKFGVAAHFKICPICKDHGVIEDDFEAYMGGSGS